MHLSRAVAFSLQASIIVSLLAGSSAPTPLYAIYQAAWGFTPLAITIVFGIYALAVLATLLVFGRLSDHVGRRPLLIVAMLLQSVAMVVFVAAADVPALIIARILQGISTGMAAGAVGAGMLDIDRAKGTIANAIGPMTGTAIGGMISSVLVKYLPAPLHLVYLVFLAIFLAQLLGVARMAETVSPKPGALASLRPQFRLPPAVRAPMLLAIPTLTAAWALAGFYGSLGPTLVRQLAGGGSVLLGGFTLFVLAGSGALALLCLRRLVAQTMMQLGTAAIFTGVALTILSTTDGSLGVFFVGIAVAGVGFGAGFQGAIRSVVPLAQPHERAGVLSILYVVAYLAMGFPAVLGGVRIVHGGGLLTTAREYGIAVMVLAAVALLGTLSRRQAVPAMMSVLRKKPAEEMNVWGERPRSAKRSWTRSLEMAMAIAIVIWHYLMLVWQLISFWRVVLWAFQKSKRYETSTQSSPLRRGCSASAASTASGSMNSCAKPDSRRAAFIIISNQRTPWSPRSSQRP
jgi:MFS family permease